MVAYMYEFHNGHYVRDHNVKPPPEFLAHLRSKGVIGASASAGFELPVEGGVALPTPERFEDDSIVAQHAAHAIIGLPEAEARRRVEAAGSRGRSTDSTVHSGRRDRDDPSRRRGIGLCGRPRAAALIDAWGLTYAAELGT